MFINFQRASKLNIRSESYMKRRATFSIYIRPAIQPTAFHLFLLQRP